MFAVHTGLTLQMVLVEGGNPTYVCIIGVKILLQDFYGNLIV